MLKAETKKKIATLLKIKETDLDAAIKSDKEEDLTIADDLHVLTNEELETRDNNQKKEGEKTGKEIGIKEVKKAAGLPEDAPAKDPAKVAQAIIDKATADAKIKPDEKVIQLTDQVTLLKSQLSEKDIEIGKEKLISSAASLDRKILAAFPKERSSTLTDDEYITLIKAGHVFKELDGQIIIEKDGKPLRDTKTTNPLTLSEGMKQIFTDRKGWLGDAPPPGGRPGTEGGAPPAKFTKLSEVKKHFDDQKKSMLGDEFKAVIASATKDNPEFDMNG